LIRRPRDVDPSSTISKEFRLHIDDLQRRLQLPGDRGKEAERAERIVDFEVEATCTAEDAMLFRCR